MRAALLLALLAGPALAETKQASGGTLRVLDRLSDKVEDIHLDTGTAGPVGRLTLALDDCRYPEGEPAGSIAHLTIIDGENAVFKGWMLAASPALNALDHPRFDVWLLQCDAPAAEAQPEAEGG
ncbi:DUF2155 domain-containing protein [Rhodobacteraceae bacterium CYK-10]|uniref:DUF2155 domain-containing protein n=1 Tax=Stagnihabitans tardus TaxID=2699202 RepID=A0AAE4Y946_9RHOB|nr:DUF2155 domain-containing protein [Stagnihabitans tardus]